MEAERKRAVKNVARLHVVGALIGALSTRAVMNNYRFVCRNGASGGVYHGDQVKVSERRSIVKRKFTRKTCQTSWMHDGNLLKRRTNFR